MQISPEEHELVQGCRHNDRRSQRRLYEQYAGRLKVVCLRYVKDRQEAEDVLQETFIRIYEHMDTFRFDGPLLAWMRKIAVNASLNHLRNTRHFRFQEDIDDLYQSPVSTEMSGLQHLQWQDLLLHLNQLPAGCRTIFNLHAIEGYPHQDIADLLGISVGTSKSQYSRARLQLQQMLSESLSTKP